jgi:hypothetical protein
MKDCGAYTHVVGENSAFIVTLLALEHPRHSDGLVGH